jgi:putative ABC transport system permease protein
MLIRRYREAGLSEEQARAKALARIGDLDAARAAARKELEAPVNRSSFWPTLIQDARFALRTLRRAPVFTATALVTIAVGAGATTAIFTVVNAVLLRDLPYPSAGRTMVVNDYYPGEKGIGAAAVSPEEFADFRAGTQSFDHWAAMRPQQTALTDGCRAGAGCEPERISAYAVSPELFDLLGIAPARGRNFTRPDGVLNADRVVLISDGLWQRRFGGDPGIVGRQITLGGLPRTVIGVMPVGVNFPDARIGYLKDRADVWIPINWEDRKDGRGNQYLVVLATRKPGVSAEQAQADLTHLGEGFKARFPDRYAEPKVTWRLGSVSLRDEMIGDVRSGLIALFGAVGLVLLIACANVANLMVAKGASRRRELAVRSALGANRSRLIQQLLIESLVVTGLGTALGIGVAFGSLKILLAINPGGIPRLDTATIDTAVLAFASILALVTGVVVGLVPALRQSNADPQSALADGTRGAGVGAPGRVMRHALVIAEVTLAVVVLVGSLLLIRSFIALSKTPTGVSLSNTAIAEITIPRATYDTPEKIAAFHQNLTARLAALPGVTVAAGGYPLAMSGEAWSGSLSVVGIAEGPGLPEPHAEYAVATPGFFRAAGIPIIAGRDFTGADTAKAPLAAVVDAEFARQFWPGESALGKRIATSGDLQKGPFETIVGVVGHTLRGGARAHGEPQLYLPVYQNSQTNLFYVARTSGDPRALAGAIRAAVRDEDPRVPITKLATGDEMTRAFTARDRFNVLLFAVFGVVALVLAAVGIYGVLASLVAQRTREIGIRLALGGKPAGVIRRLIGEGLVLGSIGLALGLVVALLAAQSIESLLFQIKPTDLVSYCTIAAVVLGVSVVASYIPARRAAAIDPIETLRT